MSQITFTRFRNEHNGHTLGPNGQCVDEIRHFLIEVVGVPNWQDTFDWIKAGNAVNFYDLANPKYFIKTPNGPSNHPPDGAIVVAHHMSKGSDGVYRDYGHVFNSLNSTPTYLRGFGQNWTHYRACGYEYHPHYVEYNWRVIGWMMPRVHFAL